MACTPSQLAASRKWRERNLETARARGRESERKRRSRGVRSNREWERRNPAKVAEMQHRAKCKRYGLTVEQYAELLHKQNGTCAICEQTEPRVGHTLSIDHDHACCSGNYSCGTCVRGLLCSNCNPSLGGFGDSPARLQRAIDYLRIPRDVRERIWGSGDRELQVV